MVRLSRCRAAWLLHSAAARVGARSPFVAKPSSVAGGQRRGMPDLGNDSLPVRRHWPPPLTLTIATHLVARSLTAGLCVSRLDRSAGAMTQGGLRNSFRL